MVIATHGVELVVHLLLELLLEVSLTNCSNLLLLLLLLLLLHQHPYKAKFKKHRSYLALQQHYGVVLALFGGLIRSLKVNYCQGLGFMASCPQSQEEDG